MKTTKTLKKFHFIVLLMMSVCLSASAQLKVSSAGKVSVGTTNASASTLSVNSTGNSNYEVYISGNTKVTDGVLKADVYNNTFSTGSQGNILKGLECLMELTPVQYTTSSQNASEGEETETTVEDDNDRLVYPIPNAHYAILGSDMHQYFPLLTTTDENGNYIANYSELVPLLVKAVQVLTNQLSGLIAANANSDVSEGYDDQTGQTQQQSRQLISSIFGDAQLFQNAPNPFHEKTDIRFRIPEDSQNAFICIFDMTGKSIKQIPVTSAMQSITIGGYELAAGMYIYSLIVNGQEVGTKRMILSR